jgi:cell division protease FtsH
LLTFILLIVAIGAASLAAPLIAERLGSSFGASLAERGDLSRAVSILLPLAVVGSLLGLVLLARRGPRRAATEPPGTPGRTSAPRPSPPHFKTITADRPTTRFTDVAGVDEAREEVAEIVEFLRAPDKFVALGARVPRGVLLVGPPGTGKTLLARAVAGEAGVPFISASGSEFVELYVGVGASRVRALFQEARRQAPCIVFIDEIDAVGRRRSGSIGVSHEEREQTLNQVLVEMDGFEPHTNILLVAATNRPDVLDPALLRPGRFDRQVMLDLPDARARLEILAVHARGKPIDQRVSIPALARGTAGLSGAELENLLNEAAILAARRDASQIGQDELGEALDRVIAGPRRRSRVLTEREKLITAYHETGHALVAAALPRADRVQKVSIVSRGMAGGYTRLLPEQDRNMWSKSEFEASIASALGGHVAEALVFGEVTTGPSNDLQRATEMARRMVTEFGMSEQIGPLSLGGPGEYERSDSRTYGAETARQVDLEVRRVMALAHTRARGVLETNRELLEKTARLLLEREVLESPELDQLLAGVRDWPPAEPRDGWPLPTPEAPSGKPARSFDRRRQRLRAVYNSHRAPFGLPRRWSDDG